VIGTKHGLQAVLPHVPGVELVDDSGHAIVVLLCMNAHDTRIRLYAVYEALDTVLVV
jgi:hypothetical protein